MTPLAEVGLADVEVLLDRMVAGRLNLVTARCGDAYMQVQLFYCGLLTDDVEIVLVGTRNTNLRRRAVDYKMRERFVRALEKYVSGRTGCIKVTTSAGKRSEEQG